ncbi:MAG: hypothetical protein KGS44_05350 [Alphaproteobacteria bacterium]|nr:hypothetical protein [Alphaproteobacteria bacterium]
MSDANRIAIVTVHGTGDTAAEPAGPKWFQQGSVFTEQVRARLAIRGFAADIVPILWSGANSARAREAGADELADTIKRLHGQYKGQVHIIAHSHGGNVANEAAAWLRWGRRPGKERIASITTVGTPFFKLRTGAAERFAGLAFLGVSVLSTILFLMASLVIATLFATGDMSLQEDGLFLGVLGLIVAVSLYFMLRLSLQGYRRITRPTRQTETEEAIQAIWHRNDEAIAFLQKIEAMPISPFPRWAWLRQSRNAAIVWGVRAVLLVSFIGIVMCVPAASSSPMLAGLAQAFGDGDAALAGFLLLYLTPVVFIGVYLAYRLVFGLLSDAALRPGANKLVEGALKGMAFGRDGDEVLSDVSTASHILPTQEVVLEGPLADRLQANAARAAAALIEKYRWSLFTVGADTNAALTDLAADAMTWDSLIHTTYFDHQETAEMIADHVAVRAALRL